MKKIRNGSRKEKEKKTNISLSKEKQKDERIRGRGKQGKGRGKKKDVEKERGEKEEEKEREDTMKTITYTLEKYKETENLESLWNSRQRDISLILNSFDWIFIAFFFKRKVYFFYPFKKEKKLTITFIHYCHCSWKKNQISNRYLPNFLFL